MLPELDGLEVCRKLCAEENPVPILMLTARDEDIDKILGLEFGADDYLTKPFNPRELVARIKAILRRSDRPTLPHKRSIHIGNLLLDPARREVIVGETRVELRAQEFDLLRVLVEYRDLVLSREQLLELAWGYDYFGQTRTVDVHVGHLRKKLAGSSVQIETVIGVGYKLVG
jgi:DNA-binding response OmpR family regulator